MIKDNRFAMIIQYLLNFNCRSVCRRLQIGSDWYILEKLFLTVELDFYGCIGSHDWTFIICLIHRGACVFTLAIP